MIKIICVGKLKEKYLVDACLEYTKRISKYTKIEIIELKDSNIKEERDNILKYINKEFIITLEIEGNMLDSPTLARKIDNIFLTNPNITFIIGGSDGLHDDIKNRAIFALSFARIHRSNLINNGILPIVIDQKGYDFFNEEDEYVLLNVKESVEKDEPIIVQNVQTKETLSTQLTLAPREKVMILQGGLLNAIKELGGDF